MNIGGERRTVELFIRKRRSCRMCRLAAMRAHTEFSGVLCRILFPGLRARAARAVSQRRSLLDGEAWRRARQALLQRRDDLVQGCSHGFSGSAVEMIRREHTPLRTQGVCRNKAGAKTEVGRRDHPGSLLSPTRR